MIVRLDNLVGWLLNGRRRCWFTAVALGLCSALAPAQPYVAGTTYFGRSNYIEYIAGNLPVIISAPHGGALQPAEIPDRSYGTFATDSNTEDLVRKVRTEIQNLTGHVPHIIICRLDRDKIDCNRDIVEGAQGDPEAEQAWTEFQDFILNAKTNVIARHGQGFYIDLHGHGHDLQRLELGYLLSSTQLGFSDGTLNSAAYENQASIRTLSQASPLSFPALLRGSNSFGAMIDAEGYPAVPSPDIPDPGTNAYFNGGYNTVEHSSVNGGTINGLQIESNMDGVRDTAANRTAYAKAIARVLEKYFATHYTVSLRECVPSIWSAGSGNWNSTNSWADGALPVSTNHIFFAGSGGSSTHDRTNVATGTGVLASLNFSNAVTGAYTISGNPFSTLYGITNSSTFTHVINNHVTLAGNQTFAANSGALNMGGNITNGGHQLRCLGDIVAGGVISGNGGLTKSGAGTLALTAVNSYTGPTSNQSGTISLNATATFGDGTGLLVLAGGDILAKNTRSVSPVANPILMTGSTVISGDGTLTNSLRILPFSANSITTTAGTLLIRHSGTNATATNNVFRVRFNGGGFNFTRPITVGFVGDLGSTVTQLESYNDLAAGDQTLSGNISGIGQFRRDASNAATAGRTILSGVNSYSGGTLVNAGTLLVNNPFGSGTGSGFVTVSSNGTLGGSGTIAGPVWCVGAISPGQSAGTLMLGGGLDLSGGGTNIWELASLNTTGEGGNFDQLVLTDGSLALGGSSKLHINFISSATSPDGGDPFWQGVRTWKIISLTGSATNNGATTFPAILNGSFGAGSFSNFADTNGSVWLKYSPTNAYERPLISSTVPGAATGSPMIQWSGVAGQTYEVQYKDDLTAVSWIPLATVVAPTNTVSFTDTNSPAAQRFYRIAIP